MGEDKASVPWLGTRAVERVFRLARDAGAEIAVTAGRIDYMKYKAVTSDN